MGQPGGGMTSETAPQAGELFAAMQTAVLSVSPDGRIDLLNPAAETLLNMSAHYLRGRMLADILTLPVGFDLAAEGPFAAHEVEAATTRGTRLTVNLEVSELPDRKGWRLVAMHGGSMAQRVGQRVERRSSARSVAGVAAMLAHEIKNPLAGIRGASQLVEKNLPEPDRRMTQLIRSEVDRIAALVDQMEGFTDTRPRERQAENIHRIVDDARVLAISGFGDAIHVTDAYDPSLPDVLVHRDSLIQILLNLIKNAAETSGAGARRRIRLTTAYKQGVSMTRSDGRKVPLPIELCVIDDGPGVPTELLQDMFEPFVTTKSSGRGLGLALADKMMRDMGGLLQYAREGEPPMTVFRLLLPRASDRTMA
jgi:two-component system, NtrC family, nitrogen regulation sensor histidine kinase GlnL